jgi:hypothetical protein
MEQIQPLVLGGQQRRSEVQHARREREQGRHPRGRI